MRICAIWNFIAGESRLAPIGVAVAITATITLRHFFPSANSVVEMVFVATLATGLIAGVFEKI